jgi:hypothetical protein
LCNGRTRDVPEEALQLFSVSAVDPLLAVQIDPPNLCDGLVCNGRIADGLRAITLHQPQRWLTSPCSTDLDAQGRRAVASGQSGMVELKLGGVGIGLVGVETAAVLLQYRLDASSDASSDPGRLGTARSRQGVETQRTLVGLSVLAEVNAVDLENVKVDVQSQKVSLMAEATIRAKDAFRVGAREDVRAAWGGDDSAVLAVV